MVMPPVLDRTASMLVKGYRYGIDHRHGSEARAFRTRVLGRPAVCAIGEEAVRLLYNEALFERRGVLPRPVQASLTGIDAVHTLDGPAHEHRKAMLVSAARDGLGDLTAHTAKAWDEATSRWQTAEEVVLFDEIAQLIMTGACTWLGIPVTERELRSRADDMIAMVDGFATMSPRHVRARRARKRSEAWMERLVSAVRSGQQPAAPGTALELVANHRDERGAPLPPRMSAVELLNLIRPTVAVTWFAVFGAHAMRDSPEARERLLAGTGDDLEAFVHELRRAYPFAPYVGGRALADVALPDLIVRRDDLLLIDVYGHHHDSRLWPDPYEFRPERFDHTAVGEYDLIPQGGGDPASGHRCPGEPATIALLETLLPRLAAYPHRTPPQDLSISLRRVPARVASGYVMAPTRAWPAA